MPTAALGGGWQVTRMGRYGVLDSMTQMETAGGAAHVH